jgi:hypothetical protein
MSTSPSFLDLCAEGYVLRARTPDAQRFVSGWKSPQFWEELRQRLNLLTRFPSPTSGILRSAFQIERDMLMRAAIDAFDHIASDAHAGYLKAVQQGLLEVEGWIDHPDEILRMGLGDILIDIGRGGCLETLNLVFLISSEPTDIERNRLLWALGGPSAASLGMTGLASALRSPQRLFESGEKDVIDATLFFAILQAITFEQIESAITTPIQELFAHAVTLLGKAHATWQYLPLLSWGMEFAQEHDLDVLQSGRLAPMGIHEVRIRHLFWKKSLSGFVDKDTMKVVEAIERHTPASEVIMTIAQSSWRRGAERRDFSLEFIQAHVEEFLKVDLVEGHFLNLYKLGIDPRLLLEHKDMDDKTRESFLGMDLGL